MSTNKKKKSAISIQYKKDENGAPRYSVIWQPHRDLYSTFDFIDKKSGKEYKLNKVSQQFQTLEDK